MMRKILIIFLLIIAFSIISNAQQVPSSYLFLEVVDSNKQPISQAKVETVSKGDYYSNEKSKLTDEKGVVNFHFVGFRGLPKDFIISKSGYYDFDVLAMFRISDLQRESERQNFTVELLKIPQNKVEKKLLGNEQIKREFFLAVMKGDTPKVKKLLSSGIDANISTNDLRGVPSPKEMPAMLYAADNGDIATMNEFLAAKINLRKGNSNISNILSHFIGSFSKPNRSNKPSENLIEYIDTLLKSGASLKSTNSQGETLLTVAAWQGNVELVKKLLERGVAVNDKNTDGTTPLFRLFGFGTSPKIDDAKLEIINLLLKSGADPNLTYETDYDCNAPLMMMAEHGQTDFVKLLLSYKADANLKCKTGEGVLNKFSIWRNFNEYAELFNLLIDVGADVNSAGRSGITPLMSAVEAQNIPIIKKLLSKGAAVNAQDTLGRTALIFAIQGLTGKPSLEIVELLLKSGANPNLTINEKTQESFGTALAGAIWHEPLYCRFDWGNASCWYRDSVQYASDDILKLLIAYKADVNLTSGKKDSPLVAAAKSGRINAISFLIENGADVKGEQGSLALKAAKTVKEQKQSAAEKRYFEEIIKFLESKGAK